jgi:hypothetical protein
MYRIANINFIAAIAVIGELSYSRGLLTKMANVE